MAACLSDFKITMATRSKVMMGESGRQFLSGANEPRGLATSKPAQLTEIGIVATRTFPHRFHESRLVKELPLVTANGVNHRGDKCAQHKISSATIGVVLECVTEDRNTG